MINFNQLGVGSTAAACETPSYREVSEEVVAKLGAADEPLTTVGEAERADGTVLEEETEVEAGTALCWEEEDEFELTALV